MMREDTKIIFWREKRYILTTRLDCNPRGRNLAGKLITAKVESCHVELDLGADAGIDGRFTYRQKVVKECEH
jgi:hypothetical protein